ncbi:MAG: InlB B-repeat-containing protein, partial [Oscillospiraceae bacterium]|nr:InlB B-repeat-containing protein [Oscillospiraceae bacterium]
GQQKELTVPYGATLTVAETLIPGYKTLVKHGSNGEVESLIDQFTVSDEVTVAFTNNQLISIVLVNHTTHSLNNVQLDFGYATEMYKLIPAQNGQPAEQEPVTMSSNTAKVNVAVGETATLYVNHDLSKVENEQTYKVSGTMPANGYYYTINNEPSYHEFADPAVLRVYDASRYVVKGKLRYSTSDSTVTFTEQLLVSFDANGGAWTTEMEDYHDRDGNRQVYQYAMDAGKAVAKPAPDPVWPSVDGVTFLGWTTEKAFAQEKHTVDENVTDHLYGFSTVVTEPLDLYAIWGRYRKVTFDYGEGTWTNPVSEDFRKAEGTRYEQWVENHATAVQPTDPTPPEDYVFIGWTDVQADGGKKTFTSVSEIDNARDNCFSFFNEIVKDTTLYAIYAKTAKVTFDVSTGHVWNDTSDYYTHPTDSTYTATVICGDTVRYPANPSYGEGGSYAFLRWTKDSRYKDSNQNYDNKGTVPGYNFNAAVTDDITLYTSWIDAEVFSVTVKKAVKGKADPDKRFVFNYYITEHDTEPTGEPSSFSIKDGESHTISIYATGDHRKWETLKVWEAENAGYKFSKLDPTVTQSGARFNGGTVSTTITDDDTYTVSALQNDGNSWADHSITLTVTNERDTQTVTVHNDVSSGNDEFTYTATLISRGGKAISGVALATGLTTDDRGMVEFTLSGNTTKALSVPKGAKLVVRMTAPDKRLYSTEALSSDYADADTADRRCFAIDSVVKDGTVDFVSGVCKITDNAGSTLSDGNGRKTVYMTL